MLCEKYNLSQWYFFLQGVWKNCPALSQDSGSTVISAFLFCHCDKMLPGMQWLLRFLLQEAKKEFFYFDDHFANKLTFITYNMVSYTEIWNIYSRMDHTSAF